MKSITNEGFTLIEIVTVIVVLGILSAFTFSFMDNAVRIYTVGSKQRVLYQEASYIMERMTRELRDMTDTVPTWTNDTVSDTITFTRAHVSGLQDGNPQVTFWRDGERKLYRSAGGVDRLIGKNVTQFVIAKSSASACDHSAVLTLTLQDGDQSVSVISRLAVRNTGTSYTGRCFNSDYEDIIK